jgi:hypothetical protein
MSFFNRAAIASLVVLSVPVISSAGVLVGFDLTGDGIVNPYPDPNNPGHNLGNAELPIAATTSDPGVTAGGLNTSSDFASYSDPAQGGNGTAVQVPSYVGPDAIGTDTASNDPYIEFSVTPTPGNIISISTLNAGVVIQNSSEFDILYSTDGNFADAVTAATVPTAGSWSGTFTSIDLSGVSGLQDIPSSQTTTFYLQFANNQYNDRGINQKSSTDGYALDIDGTVTAAPEPASLGLLSLGAVGLLTRRRRR